MSDPGDTRPSWMRDETLTEVDATDPVYQQVAAAMRARGIDLPTAPDLDTTAPTAAADSVAEDAPAGVTEGFTPSTDATGTDSTQSPTARSADAPTGADAAPAGESDQTGAGGAATVADDAATPATMAVPLPDGQSWDMSVEQARYLLDVHSWLNAQTDDTKSQWAQIEHGTARAIPTEEYTQFQAWKSAGSPGPASNPAPDARPDLSYLDGDAAAYVARLEAAQAARPAVPIAEAFAPRAPASSELAVHQQRIADQTATQRIELGEVTTAVASEYGLDAAQQAYLQRVTTELGVVPGIAQRRRVYSPTGSVIAEPPFKDVIREAYEVAMVSDPTLRAIRDNVVHQRLLTVNESGNKAVAAKKANAGSLATAPSAAVPGRNLDPRVMTHEQRRAAMVAEVAASMQ